jgi:hypothetical protein
MKIKDDAEKKEIILRQKPKLEQMLDVMNVEFEDPYSFIIPEKKTTELISSIKANRWIFTKSNL